MKKDPWHRNHLIRDAIYSAIQAKMRASPEIYILGEGSHMKIHYDAPEIEKEFPGRFLTLPISEDGNTNFAVGMSLTGLVPIIDVISSDFLYRTMDAICNTVAKTQVVHSPRTIIIRAEFLTGGPTSGQRVEGLFTGIPGLNVVVPCCPRDAGQLMTEALERPEPTLFFEERMIDDGTLVDADEKPNLSFGAARMWRWGTRATIATYGLCVQKFLVWDADVDIVDLRSLWPLDVDTVAASVTNTGHLIVVEPADTGVGARLIAQVAARKDCRGLRYKHITGPRAVIPACRELHDRMIPGPEDVQL